MSPVKAPCACGGRLVKAGPHAYQCRACRQLWRDDHLPPFLTMVTPETDLPPWFPAISPGRTDS